ncbi:MAG TPA: glycosyltransferase family A protein [Actinomycetota bacterium]|nr:glycosyltransferase family A protein [Actinomycetota bacterium]
MTRAPRVDVVVPTVGRSSLRALLASLDAQDAPAPEAVVVVDDRAEPGDPLELGELSPELGARVRVVRGPASGPAAARNAGWAEAASEWVAFVDDDVVLPRDWLRRLRADLAACDDGVAGSQGRVRVPLPEGRRPTDWERNVKGLEDAAWATADMAYRRCVLEQLGGFDERFHRAYREDADLALRALAAGYRLVRGRRRATHPVRPADPWVSVRLQAGNGDDALMAGVHGSDWRRRAGAPAGRRPVHVAVTACGVAALAAAALGRRRVAATGAALWGAGVAELAWARIAPGPRSRDEVARMVATSALIPAAATWSWLAGLVRHRNERLLPPPRPARTVRLPDDEVAAR